MNPRCIAEQGLNLIELAVLMYLERAENGAKNAAITRDLGLSVGLGADGATHDAWITHKVLHHLAEGGYVVRQDENDKRWFITPAGRERIQ